MNTRKCINILFLVLTLFAGCKESRINCNEESLFIATYYDGTGETKGERLIIFNLCDSLLKLDTIEMSYFKYAHHDIENTFLSFHLPSNYEIKKVERVTSYNATIWSDKPNVYQFLRLNKLSYLAKRDLYFYNSSNFKRTIRKDAPEAVSEDIIEIENGYDKLINVDNLIFYPDISTNDYILNQFLNVTKDSLLSAINKELENSKNYMDETNSTYENKIWLSYIDHYNKGAFLKNMNIFEIDYFEVYIKLKILKDGKSIEKILKYNIHVGN
jgi:hypothetical protein